MQGTARAGSSYEVEYRLTTKSGEIKWVLARGKVVQRDKEGTPLRAAGARPDMTARGSGQVIPYEVEPEKMRRRSETLMGRSLVTVRIGDTLHSAKESGGESPPDALSRVSRL